MPTTSISEMQRSESVIPVPVHRRLNMLRLAVTGSITAAVLFAFCWIAAYLVPGVATHRYIELFTRADVRSGTALVEGICWSLLAGLIVGALFALVYNALEALERH